MLNVVVIFCFHRTTSNKFVKIMYFQIHLGSPPDHTRFDSSRFKSSHRNAESKAHPLSMTLWLWQMDQTLSKIQTQS